jgi:hypothetical protein
MKNLAWLVFGLVVVALWLPAGAAEDTSAPLGDITVGKQPFLPGGSYEFKHIGETIYWSMYIENPEAVPMTVVSTEDHFAMGTPGQAIFYDLEPELPFTLPYPFVLDPTGGANDRVDFIVETVVTPDIISPDGYVHNFFQASGINNFPPPRGDENTNGDAETSVLILNPCIEVTKDVCGYSKPGDEVYYDICVTNCSDEPIPGTSIVLPTELYNVTVVDDVLGDLTDIFFPPPAPRELAPGETICREIMYVVPDGAPNPLINVVTATGEDVTGWDVDDTDVAEVMLVNPAFTVQKVCLTPPDTPCGEPVGFGILVENTGDVALAFAGDVLGPFTLDPGLSEYWEEWEICECPPGYVTDVVTITATIPPGYCGLPNELEASAEATCECIGGDATRTPGFWQTHCEYTQTVFDRIGPIDLGWKMLNDYGDVFGIFWANIARESDKSKRDPACHAQMIGSFQLLAAILNTGIPNGANPGSLISDMQTALSNCDTDEILRLAGELDAFNNSGDDIEIEEYVPPADPKCAKDLADIPFADCGTCP